MREMNMDEMAGGHHMQCIDDMKHSDTLEDPEWTLPWLGKQV